MASTIVRVASRFVPLSALSVKVCISRLSCWTLRSTIATPAMIAAASSRLLCAPRRAAWISGWERPLVPPAHHDRGKRGAQSAAPVAIVAHIESSP
jgi:hypothetical protein